MISQKRRERGYIIRSGRKEIARSMSGGGLELLGQEEATERRKIGRSRRFRVKNGKIAPKRR